MEIIISVVATIISLVTLLVTWYQIRLSNKQQLFDRRLECFLKVKELFAVSVNFSESKDFIECGPDYLDNVKIIYKILTNTNFLLDIKDDIYNLDNKENINNVNKKIEELKKLKTENELIFKNKKIENICDFIQNYTSVLKRIINFQLFYNRIKNYEPRFDESNFKDAEILFSDNQKSEEQKYIKEIEESSCGLINSIKNIQENNSFSKLKKKIKLI